MDSITIYDDYDIAKLNTLGVSASVKKFVEISSEAQLLDLFTRDEFKQNARIFLGGGSNILFTKNFDGIVVLNKLEGIQILEASTDSVRIRAMSGVLWHTLVMFTVERGYWGLENLSFIPGTVGGAPVQNIGAYGAEFKDVLESVEAYSVRDGAKRIFTKDECELGYRESVFKSKLKGQYFITAVVMRLSKVPQANLSYKILADFLREHHLEPTTPRVVSDAVTAIRRSKLPDPHVLGNAGSFFKNVFVSLEEFKKLQTAHPEIKYFIEPARNVSSIADAGGGDMVKIPAAWLIESCGPEANISWKGYRVGRVGVHSKHALILVNYGGGTGGELYELAQHIIKTVCEKFGLMLTPEVNLVL